MPQQYSFEYLVRVTTEKSEGKSIKKAEVEEAVREALVEVEDLINASISAIGEDGSEYTVTEFSVEEPKRRA